MAADVLAQAVAVLYGTQDPAERNRANEWLNTFAETTEAWETSLNLVGLNNGHAVEVQFFAANMLYNKVRREFHALGEGEKQGVLQALRAKLQSIVSSNDGLVKDRVAMSLALGSVFSNAPGSVVSEAMAMLSIGEPKCDQLSFLMLNTLAEEAESLDTRSRVSFSHALNAFVADIFKFLDESVQRNPQRMNVSMEALGKCVAAFIGLQDCEGKGAVGHPIGSPTSPVGQGQGQKLSLGAMASTYSNLFNFLLNGIVANLVDRDSGQWDPEEESGRLACAEAIAMLVKRCPQTDMHLYPQLMRYLLGENSAKLISNDSGVEAMARIAEALTSNHGPFFQWQEGLVLAAFFLQALKVVESRRVKETLLEFFIDLNCVPMHERLPQLRSELYQNLLVQLVGVAAYSPGFTTWEEDGSLEDDEESFHRFREQFLAEIFETAYDLLGVGYLKCVAALFARSLEPKAGSGGVVGVSWEQAEAAIFALRIVWLKVKQKVMPKGAQTQAAMAEATEANQILKIVFNVLLGPNQDQACAVPKDFFLSHYLLVEGVSRLIGSYAQWFSKNPESPIEESLAYLIRGMQHPGNPAPAPGKTSACAFPSHAFQGICMKCGHRFKSRETVFGLIAAINAIPEDKITLQDKQALVEGVSRLINLLKPEDAKLAAEQLLHPVLSHLGQTFVASCGGKGAFELDRDLQVFASAIRFFEFTNIRPPTVHPTMHVLQRSWETFEAILASKEAMEVFKNVEGFCAIFTHVMQSARQAAADAVPMILSRITKVLREHWHWCCLEVVAVAVDLFGESENVNLKMQLREAVHQSFSLSFAFLATVKLQEHGDHVQAVFDVASRCLMFAPEIVLDPGVLGTLVQTCANTITLKERQSVMAVNIFLSQLLTLAAGARAQTVGSKAQTWAAANPMIKECFLAHGKVLVWRMVLSLAETCPAHLIRAIASCLYQIKTFVGPQGFDTWLVEIVSGPTCAVLTKFLAEEDLRVFAHVVLRQPSLERPKFEAVLADFAKVCRREETPECLRMYE